MRMPFGQHKGQPLSALPLDYLDWLLKIDLREPLASAVREERALRQPWKAGSPDRTLARRVIDAGYRALALQSHPDRGGEVSTMQKLNATVEWLRHQLEVVPWR